MGRPGGNPDIIENTRKTRFSSTRQPSKRGFAKQKLKAFAKNVGWNRKDLQTFMTNILLVYNVNDIKEMIKDKELPMVIWCACIALISDAKRGQANVFRWLIEFIYGKEETLTIKSGDDITQLTREQMIERIKSKKEELSKIIESNKEDEKKELKEI